MADRQTRLRRRWLYIPWAIAAVVLLAYFMLWRTGAHEMKKAVGVWVDDQRAAGYTVSHGDLIADGFPFFLRLHIEDPQIAAPGVWDWRTERLTIDALPYDLNKLIFSTRSEQRISLADYGEWRMTADDFRVSVANDKKRDWVFAATIGGAKAARAADGATVSLESLIIDLSPGEADKTILTLGLSAAKARVVLGGDFALDKLQTSIAATQTHALGDPALWRNAGGVLQINGFFAQLEEGRFAAAGALSLDGEGRPQGALKTELIAPAPFIRLLAETGAMSEEEAESAAASLTLATIAAGGKLSVPIELKNGAAHLAGVKLADLPTAD